jgi:excinuclease ABC subunit C
MKTLREQAAELPVTPGVYLFKNAEGEVMYVGKAIRLRERVRSYFAKDLAITRHAGLENMMKMAVTIDHHIVPSELEALLLEARLIRQFKPRYNIRLRDDKSFVVIKIDLSHPFPPISIGREKELEDALISAKRAAREGVRIKQKVNHVEYYGPFTSAGSVRSVMKTIRAIWPFRDCSPSKYHTYEALGHGCLFASLHLCDAPCAAKISQEEYRENISQIQKFLRGERQSLLEEVRIQMDKASEEERYENAKRYRDRLYSLEHFQHIIDTFRDASGVSKAGYEFNSETDLRVECYDISNNQGAFAVGSLISGIIQRGKTEPITSKEDARKRFLFDRTAYRKFKVQTVIGISDTDMLTEVLERRLKRGVGKSAHWKLPDMIFVDGGKGQLKVALKVRELADLQKKLGVASVAKGPTRKRVDLYGDDFDRFPMVEREAWIQIAEQLREEAHRFAISYYRMLHRRALLSDKSVIS